MLSYRHAFHAGNFADLLKHIVVVDILESLTRKDKAFEYIDTHAGAGLYDLESDMGQKLAEHRGGIERIQPENWPELSSYFRLIEAVNAEGGRRFYPGSPCIAMKYLRPQDKAWLFELHPQDSEALRQNIRDRNVHVERSDGYQGLLAHVPPPSRRALVLVDPSYEVKTEYEIVVNTLIKAHRKFATGIYAVWYPVVDRARIEAMEKSLRGSGIRRIDRYELAIAADSQKRGMTASGMIVINPPWGLREKMAAVLPRLVSTVGGEGAFSLCEEWVGE